MTGMNVVAMAAPIADTAEEAVELRAQGGGGGGSLTEIEDERYEIPLFGVTDEDDNLCAAGCYAIVDTGTSGEGTPNHIRQSKPKIAVE